VNNVKYLYVGDVVKLANPLDPTLGIVTDVCSCECTVSVLWADGDHWVHDTQEGSETFDVINEGWSSTEDVT